MKMQDFMNMDFSAMEERIAARLGSNPNPLDVGYVVHDEWVMHDQDVLSKPGKKPWERGFIPKQGKPVMNKPRHVEGFKLAVEGGKVVYRRGDCHIAGSHFLGWDVFEKPWGTIEDPAPLLHFTKLDAAVVWVKLRLADRPELDEEARQQRKGWHLFTNYDMPGRQQGKSFLQQMIAEAADGQEP